MPRDAAIEAYVATYGEPPLPDADGFATGLLARLRVTARDDGPDALPDRAEVAALCGGASRALRVYDDLRHGHAKPATRAP